MAQNLKVKVKKTKITERKNKPQKSKNGNKAIVTSVRKKEKIVKINKIEEMAKALCATTQNKLKILK